MQALLARRISRHGYTLLLHNLHALYAALEQQLLEEPDVQGWRTVVEPLRRTAALQADLRALGVPRADALPLDPTAVQYCARLATLRGAAAHRLAAHVYVRYLGDLHGGQVLAPLVRALFGLSGPEGTRFYDFGDADAVQRSRSAVRHALGTLSLTDAQADEVVDEAVWSFAAHCEMFEGIARCAASAGEAADLGVERGRPTG